MDRRFSGFSHLFLDADDTLWENDVFFRRAEDEFVQYMLPYADEALARKMLSDCQEAVIPTYGYGSKTYMLAMLDAAVTLVPERFDDRMYSDIKDIIYRLTTHPFEWLDGAEETVRLLARRYSIIIATKGDLCEQMRKLRQSGIGDCIQGVEVMESKSVDDYRNLAAKTGIEPERFLMAGNAARSDILPVLEMGGWAVHIPFHITWSHELADLPSSGRLVQLTHINQLRDLLL